MGERAAGLITGIMIGTGLGLLVAGVLIGRGVVGAGSTRTLYSARTIIVGLSPLVRLLVRMKK